MIISESEKWSIVYLGGSITQGASSSELSKCWASLVAEYFNVTYPEKNITHYNMGIGGTGSDLGLFRLERDVLSKKPDLVFVEFAINDSGSDPMETKKFMEGIVRGLLKSEKPPVIIFIYTSSRRFHACTAVHEEVATYYGIHSIDLQAYLRPQVEDGKRNMEEILNDEVHPNDHGHKIYADYIVEKLMSEPDKYFKRVSLPEEPLMSDCYAFITRFDPAIHASVTGDWQEWGESGIMSETPGDVLTYEFSGSMIAVCNRISKYGGKCRISIDGEESKVLSTYWNTENQPVMWYKKMNLSKGRHTLTVEVLEEHDERSCGCRIAFDSFISEI